MEANGTIMDGIRGGVGGGRRAAGGGRRITGEPV